MIILTDWLRPQGRQNNNNVAVGSGSNSHEPIQYPRNNGMGDGHGRGRGGDPNGNGDVRTCFGYGAVTGGNLSLFIHVAVLSLNRQG